MNVSIHLPEGSIERLLSAIERLANAAERIAGPPLLAERPKPYDRSLWGYTDNATSRAVEEEDQREAAGFGPSYEQELEAAAFGPADRPDDKPKG